MTARRVPTIAIVGRTNVGKSTLFNSFLGRRVSIVEDIPGVTRDRHYAFVDRFSFPFTLIDTGGLIGEEGSGLEDQVQTQAKLAIEESDLVLAIFDGIAGVHPNDADIVRLLRKSNKDVIYVINKCEKPSVELMANEFYRLGINEASFVSAAHNVGIHELVAEIQEKLKIEDHEPFIAREKTDRIKLAVIGKPNVGKSSIVNKILGEDRLVTSSIAGTTTDTIDIELTREGQTYQILDTAGLRKKSNVEDASIERYANLHALTSLASCDVAVLVMDASEGLPSEQDAKIAGLAHERGRGLVLVMNKWDLVEKDNKTVKAYTDGIYNVLKFARYAPIVYVSAKTGKRCPSILQEVKQVYENWTHRIKTAQLNKILHVAFERKPPPVYRGAPIKLFFATQVSAAPPEIVVFVNHPDKVNFSYQRYIKNTLRESFPFSGTDLKVVFKKKTDREAARRAD